MSEPADASGKSERKSKMNVAPPRMLANGCGATAGEQPLPRDYFQRWCLHAAPQGPPRSEGRIPPNHRPTLRASAPSRGRVRAAVLRYHVVQACVGCLDPGADNGHYWLFTVGHVAMSNRCDEGGATVEWRGLAHNASDSGAPTVFTAPVPEHLLCCICYQLLHEPMCCPCGHTFCRGCIEHELDVRRRCPLDRTPVAKADLYPNLLAQDTINGLEIRCRFGLRRVGPRRSAAAGAGADDGDAGAWEADPHGCPATVALHARQQHESDCPFRTRAGTATATPAQTAASAAACGGPCAGAPQEPPGSTASPSRRGQTCGGLDPALPHGSATSRGCAVAAPQSPPGPGGRGDAQATSCDAEVRRLVKRRFARSPSERGPSSPRGAPATGRTASPAPLPGRARLPLGAGEGQRRQ